MTTVEPKGTTSSRDEENSPLYFREWLKRYHQELDLTQAQLAKRAGYTVFTMLRSCE